MLIGYRGQTISHACAQVHWTGLRRKPLGVQGFAMEFGGGRVEGDGASSAILMRGFSTAGRVALLARDRLLTSRCR